MKKEFLINNIFIVLIIFSPNLINQISASENLKNLKIAAEASLKSRRNMDVESNHISRYRNMDIESLNKELSTSFDYIWRPRTVLMNSINDIQNLLKSGADPKKIPMRDYANLLINDVTTTYSSFFLKNIEEFNEYYKKANDIISSILPHLNIQDKSELLQYLVWDYKKLKREMGANPSEKNLIQKSTIENIFYLLLINDADPLLSGKMPFSFFRLSKNDTDLQKIYKEAQKEIQARSKVLREQIVEALPEMPDVLANIIAEYVHYLPSEENK